MTEKAQSEIAKAQEASLLTRLLAAQNRIALLERDNAALRAQNARVLQEVLDRLRQQAEGSDEHMMFHAQRTAVLLEGLTGPQRQDIWRGSLEGLGVTGPILALHPHEGGVDPINIVVRGCGGYGDMLYLTMIVRSLYHRFEAPRIFVVHEHPAVEEVFSANPYTVQAFRLTPDQMHPFLAVANTLDVVDLIADVRYVVSYAAPPRSRVPEPFLQEANRHAWEWQKFARREWPFLNNLFSKEVQARGMSKYDLLQRSANLSFSGRLFGDFHPPVSSALLLDNGLAGRPFITVHHGADRNMASLAGVQTKNLPLETWAGVVEQLKARGFEVVQLGEAHEMVIPGVTLDLRGRASLAQTAAVLRHAQVHVDTEGGIVHLARALGTRSVVAFGPTPVGFFGYPQNVNLAPGACGDCWWTTQDWAKRCPRGLSEPACMESHSAESIVAAVLEIAEERKRIAAPGSALMRGEPVASLLEEARAFGRRVQGPVGFVVQSAPVGYALAEAFGQDDRIELHRLVAGGVQGSDMAGLTSAHCSVPGRIAADTDSLAGIFLQIDHCEPAEFAELLAEAARCLRPSGSAVIVAPLPAPGAWQACMEALRGRAGGRLKLDAAFELPAAEPDRPDAAMRLTFTVEVTPAPATADRGRAGALMKILAGVGVRTAAKD